MSLVTTSIDARGVATLTLNRADKHNALDGATLRELHDSLIRVEQDERVRVVVLTGAGASFCASLAIGEFHGVIAATTPHGSQVLMVSDGPRCGVSSVSAVSHTAAK